MAPTHSTELDTAMEDGEQQILDVLDLPQLYTKPSAETLLLILSDLSSQPPSWSPTPRTISSLSSGISNSAQKKRKFRSEGIPRYLTSIISNPLAWIEDDEEREQVWEAASMRLSERSGRSGMGAMSRTFEIAMPGHLGSSNATVECHEHNTSSMLELTLHEPSLTGDNLGLKTWASSFLLARRLASLRDHLPCLEMSCEILELGSGTGLVGMAAAALFQTRVILTDLPDILPNLEHNTRTNAASIDARGGSTETTVLDWCHPSAFQRESDLGAHARHSFHLILAADPIYSVEHPHLLSQAIDHHLSRSGDARVVIELPLRPGYSAEREDLRTCMGRIDLLLHAEGEEVGFDDWSTGHDHDELSEITCWWSVWRRA